MQRRLRCMRSARLRQPTPLPVVGTGRVWRPRRGQVAHSRAARCIRPRHPCLRHQFVRRRSGSAAPTAKVQVSSHVIIDHRNAPPGTTTTVAQPPAVTVNLGEAWAW